ncbi:transposase, partial [Billgrantia azerbaijanica]
KDITPGGHQFAVTFINDYSRFVTVYLMAHKSEVLGHFQEYKTLMENQMGKKLQWLRSDNGGEYINREFDTYLSSTGIQHETLAPYTPQQNGIAKHMNRTLFNITRSLLLQGGAPHYLWGDALLHAAYLNNRPPTKALSMETPFKHFLQWEGDHSML